MAEAEVLHWQQPPPQGPPALPSLSPLLLRLTALLLVDERELGTWREGRGGEREGERGREGRRGGVWEGGLQVAKEQR
eukprot:3485717-Rhodomonas_salina.1